MSYHDALSAVEHDWLAASCQGASRKVATSLDFAIYNSRTREAETLE